MKDLPADPPVWTPPPERWFDRHEHETVEGAEGQPCLTQSALTRTLMAMWLLLHDHRRSPLPIPTKERKFTNVELEMARKLVLRLGAGTMTTWRMCCAHVRPEEDVQDAFLKLLAAKGICDE